MKNKYPRNMLGYGSNTPDVKWPNNSKNSSTICSKL